MRWGVFGETFVTLLVIGGLPLLLLAIEILRGVDFPVGPGGDVTLVPLASPLGAGPGAIATVSGIRGAVG